MKIIDKKADFNFKILAGILILLILLIWVIIWYGGLRKDMIQIIYNFFK